MIPDVNSRAYTNTTFGVSPPRDGVRERIRRIQAFSEHQLNTTSFRLPVEHERKPYHHASRPGARIVQPWSDWVLQRHAQSLRSANNSRRDREAPLDPRGIAEDPCARDILAWGPESEYRLSGRRHGRIAGGRA